MDHGARRPDAGPGVQRASGATQASGWWSDLASGVSCEELARFAGAAVALQASTALCSSGAHGVMTPSDIRSIEGDQQVGLGSLPARLGPEHAHGLACVVAAGPQVAAIASLASWRILIVCRMAGALPGT